MVCPKCREKLSWYVDGLLRPSTSSRVCPGCGAKLELLNSGIGIVVNSVLIATGSVYLWMKQVPYAWLWVMMLFVFCWLATPVWVRSFGRVVVSSYTKEQEARARRLAMESTATTIALAGWVFYMALTVVVLPYYCLMAELEIDGDLLRKPFGGDAESVRGRFLGPRGIIELTIGAVSLGANRANARRRSRLRAEARGTSSGSDEPPG